MKLIIETGSSYSPERKYIIDVIMDEFLGLDYMIVESDCASTTITLQDDTHNRKLIIEDCLFNTPERNWLSSGSLPEQPLVKWAIPQIDRLNNLGIDSVPIIYGKTLQNGDFLQLTENTVSVGLDVFGSVFYMLTRCEEAVKENRDSHGRFPQSASLAFAEDFHELPVVDVYTEILWELMHELWNGLERRESKFRINLTHDVDNILCYAWQPLKAFIRSVGGDLIRRRSPLAALDRTRFQILSRANVFNRITGNISESLLRRDPCYNLDYIMDQSEINGLTSSFFFMAGQSDMRFDGHYNIRSAWIRRLLKRIHDREHIIGLHPSYKTCNDADRLASEFRALKESCADAAIEQNVWGGRQHYLRWSNPETWQNWEDAGLNYDSSLGYAESPGFRSGTCHEYPVFNLKSRRKLKLREKPLILMDASVLDYQGRSFSDIPDTVFWYRDLVRAFNGDFTILFHNCRLASEEAKQTYPTIIDNLAAR